MSTIAQTTEKKSSVSAKFAVAGRIILGLVLVIFGSNKFLGFMPMPAMPEAAQSFMGALFQTGYLLPLVAVVEIAVGLALLVNRYVALALLLLAPISVNIILFHLMLDPAGTGGAALVTLLNIYLLFVNKDKYKPVLSAK